MIQTKTGQQDNNQINTPAGVYKLINVNQRKNTIKGIFNANIAS